MSPSPEAIAVQSPLSVISDLFSRSSSSSSDESFFQSVHEHFSSVLSGGHISSVPRLQDVNARGKLVRFRCMIQDTGLANEVYVLDAHASSSSSSQRSGAGCCAYSEGPAGGSPILDNDEMDYSGLRERQVVYAVSVPGETEWYRRSQDASSSSTIDDLSGGVAALNVSTGNADRLLHKQPIPDDPHAGGALIKLYPFSSGKSASTEDQPYKATEIVEFVGVLDFTPFPSSEEASTSEVRPNELVKTLHAVMAVPVGQGSGLISAPSSPGRPAPTQDPAETRAELVQYLAQSLEGDTLAAEWLLLSLLGKTHARRGALALGQLPIDLVLPSSSSISIPSLLSSLRVLLPRVASLDFTIPKLNAQVYFPSSESENLHSGRLQLAPGTAVLVDETQLGEGQLKDRGVRNVQSLARVVKDQVLGYRFPYHEFEFHTDLKVVIVSKGKSLLPMECVVLVQPSRASPAEARDPTPEQLSRWRALFLPSTVPAPVTENDFSIPASVSEHIQTRFVAQRQAASASSAPIPGSVPPVGAGADAASKSSAAGTKASVTQEDLVLRLGVARLMCASEGRKELDVETWERTEKLDEQRKARLALPAN